MRILLASLLLIAGPALAQEAARPTLRAAVTVSSELVRLGDLVDGLATGADEPVFRAPELGTTGTVQAVRVVDAARQHGINTVDTGGLGEIAVTRASRTVTLDEMKHAIVTAVARQNGLDDEADLVLAFDAGARALHLEAGLAAPLQVMQIAWSPTTGRFDATLGLEGSRLLDRDPVHVGGMVQQTLSVPVFMSALNRGDVVRASDVAMQRLPRTPALAGAADSLGAVIGQAVRRTARIGQPAMTADLTKPEIVDRNDDVLITFEVPGMVLTVRGKALQGGAQGDMVPVLNAQSKRVVQAAVIAPGRVSVATSATLASIN